MHIRAHLAGLEAQGMARSSAARKLSAIRQFHRFLHGDGLSHDNPATGIDSPRAARPLPKMISRQDVEQLAEAARERVKPRRGQAPAQGLAAALPRSNLLYATGLRVSELVGLTRAAATAEKDFILVKGKGGRERLVPVSGTARAALRPIWPFSARRGAARPNGCSHPRALPATSPASISQSS